MKINNLNLAYFSATFTTQKIVRTIADSFQANTSHEYNLLKGIDENIIMNEDDLFIIGAPVYAGRIPQVMIDSLNKISGNSTPAIVVCVYGNRDYDDALLELKDIVEKNGFKVISAGAFIGTHSIFPKVAANRPDKKDLEIATLFGEKSSRLLSELENINSVQDISIKGNFPYKEVKKIPLTPKAGRKCNNCGICAKECPVNAIPKESPKKTNKDICISCAHCIAVCPQKARNFGGLLYKLAGKKFVPANIARKKPEVIFSGE